MRKPNQNQSTELYLEKRLLIKILWECELLGNNSDFLLLKGSSNPFPKYSSVICGRFATQCNKFSIKKRGGEWEKEAIHDVRWSPGFWRYNWPVLLDLLPTISIYWGSWHRWSICLWFPSFFSHSPPHQQLLYSLHLESLIMEQKWAGGVFLRAG